MGDKSWWAVECPDLGNLPYKSCIPEGSYPLVRTDSARFGANSWEIIQVPYRSGIRIHVANYSNQLQGCIGLGNTLLQDLKGVGHSQAAIQAFHRETADQDEMVIRIARGPVVE